MEDFDKLERTLHDTDQKLKAIAMTLQDQIEEMKQRIDDLDKDILLHERLFNVHHELWNDNKQRIEKLENK